MSHISLPHVIVQFKTSKTFMTLQCDKKCVRQKENWEPGDSVINNKYHSTKVYYFSSFIDRA